MYTAMTTQLTLTADPDGRRARLVSTSGVLRAMTLSCGADSARVSLVPQTALLLAGDAVSIRVHVGPGASLEIVETSGTVAYDMHGASATWDVEVVVGAAGSLRWDALPFVVAQGADVRRTTRVTLGHRARLWLRETLVLGRAGEGPGRLSSRTEVADEERDIPLLVEELDSRDLSYRVLDSALAIGHDAQGGMQLEAGGRLHRCLTDQTHLSTLESGGHDHRRHDHAR